MKYLIDVGVFAGVLCLLVGAYLRLDLADFLIVTGWVVIALSLIYAYAEQKKQLLITESKREHQ